MSNFQILDLQLFAEDPALAGGPTVNNEGQVEPQTGEITEPSATPAEPVFEIDGQKYALSEIKRWRDTRPNLEKYYYTKLNELRSTEENYKHALELYNWLQANPDAARMLVEYAQGGGTFNTSLERQPGETASQYADRLDRIERMMTSFIEEYRTSRQTEQEQKLLEQAERLLDNQIMTLKAKYKDFNEQEVLKAADMLGVTDLEVAYKYLLDPERLRREAVEEYLKQKRQGSAVPVGGGSGGISYTQGSSPRNYQDAYRSALRRLTGRMAGE